MVSFCCLNSKNRHIIKQLVEEHLFVYFSLFI